MSKTEQNKSFLLREANPGWIVIAIIVSNLAIIVPNGIIINFETIVWGIAVVVMIAVILYMMKTQEIVVSSVEVKNQAQSKKQSAIVLGAAVVVMISAIAAAYLGILPLE